jgi:hypothetical protein
MLRLRMAGIMTLAFGVQAVGTAALVRQHRAVGSSPQDPHAAGPVRQESPAGSHPLDANKAIAQQQLKLAREALRDLDLMHKGEGLSLTDPRFMLWERRQLEAIRAAGAGKAEDVATLENYLKQAKEQERLARVALEKGEATRLDVRDAQYRVLEAEAWLNQEKSR